MALPPDACSSIVQHVADSRPTLLSLCTVSRQFQIAAEKALYNTLQLSGSERILQVCEVLARTPRVAIHVAALSIHGQVEDSDDEEEDGSWDEPPPVVWETLCFALRRTTRLRFLNLHFQGDGQVDKAWVFHGSIFQLRTFHCDLAWDDHLESFLSTQTRLVDLFISDFRESSSPLRSSTSPSAITADTPILGESSHHHISPTNSAFLPKLSILECTFSEAAAALVPDRPLVRLKTCFTNSKLEPKRAELNALLNSLRRSRRRLRALDIADSAYTPEFAVELLGSLVVDSAFGTDLRYVGTLVLPVDGRQRLEFYGLLMRLRQLRCIEVDVSEWDPAPVHAAALRALACEIRLYCPSISTVVFVYDFERHLVRATDNGMMVYEEDGVTDNLWREV